jgi:hypothetical protein
VKFVYLADLVTRRGRGPLAYIERMRALRALMRESKADVIVSFLTNVKCHDDSRHREGSAFPSS